MNYRNIDDLNHCILQHLSILPRDFDLIVGVPRSGMFPANLLALYLNLPVTDIDSFRNGHIYQTAEALSSITTICMTRQRTYRSIVMLLWPKILRQRVTACNN